MNGDTKIPLRCAIGQSRHRGFTLVELLVVIVIIGVLMALVFGAIGRVQKSAIITKTTSNLRDSGALMALYVGDHDGELPGRNGGTYSSIGSGEKGLNAGATDRVSYSDYVQLGRYLAPYAGIEPPSSVRVSIPSLENPLGRKASEAPDGLPVLWLLNRDIKADGLTFQPFGTNVGTGKPPMRYLDVISRISPVHTWAMIQADVEAASVDYWLSAASAYKSPKVSVIDDYRLALFFDWSVARIPVHTDLRKPIDNR